jgi:hypothetical protein
MCHYWILLWAYWKGLPEPLRDTIVGGVVLAFLIWLASRGRVAMWKLITWFRQREENEFLREWRAAEHAEKLNRPNSTGNIWVLPYPIENFADAFGRTEKETEKLLLKLKNRGLVLHSSEGWSLVKNNVPKKVSAPGRSG